jgi:hypothetical protein
MGIRVKLFCGFLSLLVFFAWGCEDRTELAPMPDVGIPVVEMNTRIHLQAPDGWNSFKIGDVVGIDVEVISDDQIAFSHDYGAKIFIYEDQEWREIPNFMKYPEGNMILTQANGNYFKHGGVELDPIFPDGSKSVVIRVILIGNIYRNGQITNEQTAAFIDLKLKP